MDSNIIVRAQNEALTGEALFRQGNYRGAMTHFAEAARLRPGEGSYHIHLAFATWRAGFLDRVEHHFSAALSLQPTNGAIHEVMAWFFVEQGLVDQALSHSSAAMTLQPEVVSYKITHADALFAQGKYEAAWTLLRSLVAAGHGGVWLTRVFAKVAARTGHEREAVVRIDRELQSPGLSPIDQVRLHYAAAGLLDSLGEYDAAFTHARLANRNSPQSFDPNVHSRYVSDRIAFYTRQQLSSLPRSTNGSSRPVFIVGVTRSGTSLVEQILASHPKVFGGGELSYLSEAAAAASNSDWASGIPFPSFWNHLSVSRANQLASTYLDRIYALNSTARYVTDKMPENFLFLGTAELLLPNCRVIHCVRDPRDTCLSCHMTDFASGKDFSRNLGHLARYYQDYARLMEHWKKVLTIQVLDVRYEDLVADPAGQTKRMLEFLDLPWDDQCLNYHQNKRHVATASREQVRRPIYSSSIGRWKHYQKHIPELLALVKDERSEVPSLNMSATAANDLQASASHAMNFVN